MRSKKGKGREHTENVRLDAIKHEVNIVFNSVSNWKLSSFGASVGLFQRNRTNRRHLLQEMVSEVMMEAETPEISHCKLGDSGKMGARAKV